MDIVLLPSWNAPLRRRALVGVLLFTKKLFRTPRALFRLMRLLGQEGRASGGGVRETLQQLFRLLPFVGLRTHLIHFQWNSSAVIYRLLGQYLDAPVVISCRGSQVNVKPHNPRLGSYREALGLSFREAAAVHCVSTAIQEEACSLGLDPSKATVIRPAVDPHFFRPPSERRPTPGLFRVVSVGRLTWQKGFEYAVSAIRLLRGRGVNVVYEVIGDGPDFQRLLFSIADMELEESVILHKRLPPQLVRETLDRADAFLLSSVSEGISNAVLEAMACGLPVVTTDCGGMSEAVEPTVHGLVVPPRNPAAMAEALEMLYRDGDLRARLGFAARQRIIEEFTLEDQAKQFLQLYARVAPGSFAGGEGIFTESGRARVSA